MKASLRASALASETKPTIYFAGGFRSGWQAIARGILAGEFDILDPSSHNLQGVAEYTAWDLEAIRRSDLVLAYMEQTNPAGFALSLEVGFARGLGKLVVLVDDLDANRSKYFEMVRQVADRTFVDLMTACMYIKENLQPQIRVRK
jgi:nucleoside 2-deoxyribosyltransferase